MEIITLKRCGFKQIYAWGNYEAHSVQCALVEGHSGEHLATWGTATQKELSHPERYTKEKERALFNG
jgi:hypothetical protein